MNNHISTVYLLLKKSRFQNVSSDPFDLIILSVPVFCSRPRLLRQIPAECHYCGSSLNKPSCKIVAKVPITPSDENPFSDKVHQKLQFLNMGNDNGSQTNIGNKIEGKSEWQKYEAELQKDKQSNIEPYTLKQMTYLEQLFSKLDKRNLKSLELKDLEEIQYLRQHALYPRIRDIFEEEMRKIKAKRINFQLFLYLLSTFHIRTELQTKYKYVFRLFDCDKNMKIDANDLSKIYKMIYNQPWMIQEDYSRLVTDSLIRFGSKGQIRHQNLREMLPEDEVREFLSFRFSHFSS